MADDEATFEVPYVAVYPEQPTPGGLGVLVPQDRLDEMQDLQREAARRVWEVRGVVSDHIPLSGLGALTATPEHRLFLKESPVAIWLHRGGDRAVYFDLVGDNPEKRLDYIAVKVETKLPSTAFLLAREPLSRFLDVLARGYGLPLVYQRLDLVSPRDGQLLASELIVPPSPKGIIFDQPGSGFHQAEPFAAYDAIVREALTNPSPFYQLLCAFRLYEGTSWIRRWLRQETRRFEIDANLPSDPRIEPGELEKMGLPAQLAEGVRKANELFAKWKEARNGIAHFLLEGEEQGHVYLADGNAFQHYSIGATILLRYARQALDDLRAFYGQHLQGRHMVGSIYPMIQHRDQFIVIDRHDDKAQP
jgi:hypothetical protein